ncbi:MULTISPECIES: hypothetical protein [Bacillus]|uniref:hypothetical protein n=1 Tax=Bacillus TaxID=1386 RepID=UPI000D03F352|nr:MULTISPECIES: hypothetical protein [Bacillus]PRS42189.1 hypothetical protein C6Y02_03300 [Bacillus sp. NMCC4]PRS81788.1 hypothetical protein C6346_07545 [Bacillus sp. CJCL2]PRS85709.1 hypothetical protein C6348_10885 [Bacillus sp. YBWC18]
MRKKIAVVLLFTLMISLFAPSVYLKENDDYSMPPSKMALVLGQENSHLEIGYKETDAFWVLVGRLVLQGGSKLIKVGTKTFKKAPKSKVVNSLKNYKGATYKAGSKTYKITKSDMKHMLERHHPKYWNGTSKKTQTFFDSRLSVKDIERIAINVAKQNRTKLSKIKVSGQVEGKVDGVKYVLGVSNGHMRQLYPKS